MPISVPTSVSGDSFFRGAAGSPASVEDENGESKREDSSAHGSTKVLAMVTSSIGLSCAFVPTIPIFWTTLIPLFTRPKIACFPSRNGHG